MECRLKSITVHYNIIGSGKPILMLHGYTLDHRMMMECMEPVFEKMDDWQRIYIDLPGMGKTIREDWIRTSDDMLRVIIEFVEAVIPGQRFLIVGESYGAYIARGLLHKKWDLVDGLAMICPMIIPEADKRILPAHRVIVHEPGLESKLSLEDVTSFQSMTVIQSQYVMERYEKEILSAAKLADVEFLQEIKENGYAFSFDPDKLPKPFDRPVLILTGRQDSITGYQDAWRVLSNFPRATYAVLDGAGHNLQIEQPQLFEALIGNWLERVEYT